MLFPSVGGYTLKNTEAIICFSYGKMLFPSLGGYMFKIVISKRMRLYVEHRSYNLFYYFPTEAIICFIIFSANFPIVPMAAIWWFNDRSYGSYMITEAIICSHKFSDRSYGTYMILSSNFDKIKFEIQLWQNCYFQAYEVICLKIVISKRRRLYVKKEKHRSYNLFHIIFPPKL